MHALTSGSLSHLQSLDLSYTLIGNESTRAIVQALATSCSDLRKIDLTSTSFVGSSRQAFTAFHETLGANAWPRLEEINLNYDEEEVAGDMVSTLAATGVGTSLRHMELSWPVNEGLVVQCLADIFHQGASLRELEFRIQLMTDPEDDVDDTEISEIFESSLTGRAGVKVKCYY